MVSRRALSKRGLASVLDAFLFLTAIVALCSLLMVGQVEDIGAADRDWQRHVERAHVVLMRATLRIHSQGSIYGPDAPFVEIPSLVQVAEGTRAWTLPSWARTEVERIIHDLLGSGWGFEWCVLEDQRYSMLADGGEWHGVKDLYSSSIGAGVPVGIETRFILRAWLE